MNLDVTPNRVWFSLTGLCNNVCSWCHRKGSEEIESLDEDTIIRMAKTLAASGVRNCTLAGGEPTLHPEWMKLTNELSHIFNSCFFSNKWQIAFKERSFGVGFQ